jgi:enoyl-CoA hydratase/carnithine racemase
VVLKGEAKVLKKLNGESEAREVALGTISAHKQGPVLFAEIFAPPMNLLGPELVRDLVSLIQQTEADEAIQVLVFKSADPDYFISHVDVTKISEYRGEAAKLVGEPSLAMLFRYLSLSRLITIAQIQGRVRGAGSEFVLACDMRFAARESAIFCQFEAAFGAIPGAGGVQHLVRLMGRARALEVLLSAEDYNADLAERYGWINRAVPADSLDDLVKSIAQRIASFPAAGHAAVKNRVNAIALPPADEMRRDSDLFAERMRSSAAQNKTAAAIRRGFQSRDGEMNLAQMLADLIDE